MDISVIIPTLQAAKLLPPLLKILNDQTLKPREIIIVDSSSSDETVAIARESGCQIIVIERKDFRHGRARNLGANISTGQALLFLTQDALPANESFIESLAQPLSHKLTVAANARQVAYPSATPIEQIARRFNYPEYSSVRSASDLATLGVKTYFFSNSASIVNREVFLQVGGFSDEVIVNEDMYFCALLINNGFSVAYQAEAVVYHSHNYTLSQLFKRYFDIGVFFYQAKTLLQNIQPNREGIRYIRQTVHELELMGAYSWIPRVFAESLIKYSAFQLGLRYRLFPRVVNSRLSGQSYFW